MAEQPELLAVNPILLKIGQAGIVVLQGRTVDIPVTGKKVLLLQREGKMLHLLKQQLSPSESPGKLPMHLDLELTRKAYAEPGFYRI